MSALPTRRAFVLGAAASVLFFASAAIAGSYLDRARLLVSQSSEESDYLRSRLSDKELARLVHEHAIARVGAAKKMHVPKEVAQAHPHLLLMLENYERSAEAAVDGSAGRFFTYQRKAREEEEIFRGVLKQLGWPLPSGLK